MSDDRAAGSGDDKIVFDDDNPEWTEADFARARPLSDFPALEAVFGKNSRGRPPAVAPKRQVTLRLDADILDAFRATGAGWQTRINAALRRALPAD